MIISNSRGWVTRICATDSDVFSHHTARTYDDIITHSDREDSGIGADDYVIAYACLEGFVLTTLSAQIFACQSSSNKQAKQQAPKRSANTSICVSISTSIGKSRFEDFLQQ